MEEPSILKVGKDSQAAASQLLCIVVLTSFVCVVCMCICTVWLEPVSLVSHVVLIVPPHMDWEGSVGFFFLGVSPMLHKSKRIYHQL